MGRYSKEDIFRMVEEDDVEFIRLQFTDIFGVLKNVAITSSQLAKALDNKCIFDGSSVEGFVRIEESDMHLLSRAFANWLDVIATFFNTPNMSVN